MGRYAVGIEGHPAKGGFQGTAGTQRMAGKGLGRAARHGVAEEMRYGKSFHTVILTGGGAMQVEIVNRRSRESCHIQGLLHGGNCATAVGPWGGNMVGVAGLAITAELNAAGFWSHQKQCCSFTEIDPVAIGREGLAGVVTECFK